MSYEKPTKRWTRRDIDRMLAMLPPMEERDFVPYTWERPERRVDRGDETIELTAPLYHRVVETLWDQCYNSSAWIDPYAALPEDPDQDGIPFDVLGAHFPPEYFATATLNQVRRYLVLCTRGERFCSGHIAAQINSGSMLAALRRLRELREAMPKPSPKKTP